MLRSNSQLPELIERVSTPTGKSRSDDALRLLDRLLSKSDETAAQDFKNALIEALPPEQGRDLLLRLQLLAVYWAYALVFRAHPGLYEDQSRDALIRRSFRLGNRVYGKLAADEYFAHLELFRYLETFFSGFRQIPLLLRRLLKSSEQRQMPVFVEPIIITGCFKSSLTNLLLAHYARMLSRSEYVTAKRQFQQAVGTGLHYPWEPELNAEDFERGLDILCSDGLACCEPLQLAGLISQIRPRRIIGPNETLGFLAGLTRNESFKQSSERVSL